MKKINIDEYRQYLSQNIIDCLIFLNAKGILNQMIICGSLGLVLNKVLYRKVEDIDFLTIPDWYGRGDSPVIPYLDDSSGKQSHIFNVAGERITCWKIRLFDTKIDLLHNPRSTVYQDVELTVEGIVMFVKVEDPLVAISFKEKYVVHDKSEESREKHRKDLSGQFKTPIAVPDTVDDIPF